MKSDLSALMDAKSFIDKHGTARAKKVAEAAGTNYAYFSQIAYGHRRPSVDLAEALVSESGGELDLIALLKKPRASKKKQGASAA